MQGVVPYPPEDVKKYKKLHIWRDVTLGEAQDFMAKIYPGREAIIDERSRLTYEEFASLSDRFALGLIELGLRPSDRVLVQLPNMVEFAVIYMALQKIGVIPVLCIPRQAQKEVEYFASLSEASAYIGLPSYGKTDYMQMLGEIKPGLPALKYTILVGRGGEESPGTISYSRLMAQSRKSHPEALHPFRPVPDEVCHLIPTAGTMGMPKLVPRTHNSFFCLTFYAGTLFYTSNKDVYLVVTPIAHAMALNRLGVLLNWGGKLVLGGSTRAKDILELIQKEQVSNLIIVPTLLLDIMKEPDLEKYSVSSMQRILSGGARPSIEVLKEIKNRLNCYVINSFGMSEGPHMGCRINDDEEELYNTVGKPHCPWDDFKILNEEAKETPQGEEGFLGARGPAIFTGYYRAENINRQCFTPQGYFLTGDLARINAKGNFIITGRTKDVINRGGEKISSVEVEEMILSVPGVHAVAAVPMPDLRMGEKVCVFIQPAGGYTFNLETLTGALKAKGASVLLLPERVELVKSMPLTSLGKIDKKLLRQRLEQ